MVKFKVTFETISYKGEPDFGFTNYVEKPIDIIINSVNEKTPVSIYKEEAIKQAWKIYISRHNFSFNSPFSYRLIKKINCKVINNSRSSIK